MLYVGRTTEDGVDGEEVGADGHCDHGEGEAEEFDDYRAVSLVSACVKDDVCSPSSD